MLDTKVCFLLTDSTRKGGVEHMASIISSQLSKFYDVYLISLVNSNTTPFFSIDDHVKQICLSDNTKIFNNSKILHKFLKKYNIDVLVNVDTGIAPIGIIASFFTKVKTITWEHSNFYNNWGSSRFPIIRKIAAKFSDAFVVLTERDYDNYRNNIKKCAPLYVIPNPVEKVDAQYNKSSKTILSIGHLSPLKQFDIAIKVAAHVLKKHTDWKWVICGEGPQRSKLESLINDFDLKDKVILKGSVSDLGYEYSSAAIYVMTSKIEGLPMVLLESKSYSLPIVSFDIMTGPSDIITDGLNGYLIDPDNIDQMAEKINYLIENDDIRALFSNNSCFDIEKFDSDRILQSWINLINSFNI